MTYRDPIHRCAICDAELVEEACSYAGLQLCRRCHDGKNPSALLERGIHVQTVEETALDNRGRRHQSAWALGATGFDLPLQARFARQGYLGRRFKLDLQTGDPIFDDAIEISGNGVELERLLAFEPVRFAIMDLVAEGGVEVNDGQVKASAESARIDEVRRAVTVITWALSTFAKEAGYRALPAHPLPWLEGLSIYTQVSLEVQGDLLDLEQAARLPELTFLALKHLRLASADLTPIAWLGKLTALRLIRIEEVRDLRPLGSLDGLRALALAGCPVEDLAPLARLTSLVGLNLSNTRIKDLTPLLDLPLEELVLRSTLIEASQLQALRERRPGIKITTE